MIQQQLRRFLVVSYSSVGEPWLLDFDLKVSAVGCAERRIECKGAHTVKVWDREQGPVLPDCAGAAGLILELHSRNQVFRPTPFQFIRSH